MVRNGCYGRQAISLDLGPTPRPWHPPLLLRFFYTRGHVGSGREGRGPEQLRWFQAPGRSGP